MRERERERQRQRDSEREREREREKERERQREQYLLEVLEGELVHGVHLAHAGHHEVHDGATLRHRAILLSGQRDLLLRLLRFRQPLRDDA